MTTHYLEITLLPDPEFSHAYLMGALMYKLHRALVQRQFSNIGISFPMHVNISASNRSLGSKLRLHGTLAALQHLMEMDWLKGMRDHTVLSSVASIPIDAQHRVVHRKQFKTNVERLRRRRMQRKGESAAQAAQAIPMDIERHPDLPFVTLRSLSTGQTFALFIDHGPLLKDPIHGAFNTYGLSQDASVPWF